MSGWQAYVDNNLVGTKNLTQAAIIGIDGSIWAISSGFTVSQQDGKILVAAFQDPSGIRAKGIFLNGVKYLVLRADERSIYGKKGSAGCVCVKTKQAVLIGIYNENIQPGQAANTVEKLADYLIDAGY